MKEEIFKPGEVKRYQIVMRDIWVFPLVRLDDLEERTNDALGELKGSYYEASSRYLADEIFKKIGEIREGQSQVESSIPKHIGTYLVNQKRYDDAVLDYQRIDQMLAIIKAKKLEELESGKVKNVLQRLKALRGIQAISQALFQKALSVTTTWKIIMGAIVFVSLFTTLHFIIWSRRSGTMGEDLGLKPGEKIQTVPKPGEEEVKTT
jgi:hypothetical protein